jgi:ATP-dependent Clp protease ATP-binding subunit ClpC
MYERFTDRARKVMQLANQEAQRFNNEYIATEHILLGLVKEGSGEGARVLTNVGVDLRHVGLEIERMTLEVQRSLQPESFINTLIHRLLIRPQTPAAKRAIEYSKKAARQLHHRYVGTEHLLLGLIHDEETVSAHVLKSLGVKLPAIRDAINQMSCKVPEKAGRGVLWHVGRAFGRLLGLASGKT